MKYLFDIIVPTYNNLPELKTCLAAFEKQKTKNFRVFVCIDGSTDGTDEYLRKCNFSYDLEILTHPGNQNMGRAITRNLPVSRLDSEYLLFMDSDIEPDADCLTEHLEILKNNDVVSVGEVLFTDEDNIWAEYMSTRGKNKYKNGEAISAIYLNTQNTAFRTEYFIKNGGQDTDFSKYYGGDDTVLGIQLEQKFKLQMIFNGKAFGRSKMNKDITKALRQMKEFGLYNLRQIKIKYPDYNKVFRMDLMGKSGFIFLSKIIASSIIQNVILGILKLVPGQIRIKLIHLLVFANITKGFNQK